jgi:hypothetical protein
MPLRGCTWSLAAPFLIGAGLLLPPLQARAENPAQDERLAYKLMLGGLHVGDAVVALNQTASGYSTEMKMAAAGAMRWVQSFRAEVSGRGAFVAPAASATPFASFQPLEFRRAWSGGELANNMVMTFDPETGAAVTKERIFNPLTGAEVRREDLPWNRRNPFVPVPDELRTNALDPMTAFVAARSQVMSTGGPAKTFRVPIYDGSRRYDIVGNTAPVRTVMINGAEQAVIPVTAKIEPVFGFIRRSQKTMQGTEGKLYFTPDARFIPVQVVVGNDYFSGVMNLAADCREDAAACAAIENPPPPVAD